MARRKFLSTALAGVVIAGLAGGAATTAQAAAPAATPSTDPQPVGVVVLVDESGSLQDSGVAAERAATETIVQADPATSSQLAVVGFAGRNGGPGQSPVDVVCQPTTVTSGPNRDYLAGCTQSLTSRTEAQGNDTDFPSALSEALSLLDGMAGVKAKMIFMLTDGQLDVRRDPAYGPDPASRQNAAQAQLSSELATASQQGVSIWPLGFNQAVQSDLDQLAAGGAQQNPLCPDNSRPVARLAANTNAILASLIDAFGSARCEGHDGPHFGQAVPGNGTNLTVTIPAVATDGSIAVDKVDPGIAVTYVDPAGHRVPTPTGDVDGSHVELSGQTSPVEVLRIRDPVPGTWTIGLGPPTGNSTLDVSATVLWQGVVQSSVILDPPAPRPGATATVQLVLATRLGSLTEPSALSGINASAMLTGEGFGPITIALTPGAGGQFTGNVTIPPTGTGGFHLVGLVSGVGISNDVRPLDGVLNTGTVPVAAQVTFGTGQVAPGGRVNGSVLFQNNTSTQRDIQLRLTNVTGGLVTLSTVVGRIEPGASQVPFQLLIDRSTPLGSVRGQLSVTDATSGAVYADPVFTIPVAYPPPWYQRWWWALVLAGVLVLAVIATLFVNAARRRRAGEVKDLSARLYKDGRQVFTLHAPDGRGAEFRFAVHDEPGQPPSLQHATNGYARVVVRRSGPAMVTVAAPGRDPRQVRPGAPVDLDDGFVVEIMDDRPPRHRLNRSVGVRGTRSSTPDNGPPVTPQRYAEALPEPDLAATPRTAADDDDDLL